MQRYSEGDVDQAKEVYIKRKKEDLQIDQYKTQNTQSQFYEGSEEESHSCLGCNL